MEKINQLKLEFSKIYPCFKHVDIETCSYNNLYIARCVGDITGDYKIIKKGRIINILPKKIILSDVALKKKDEDLLFIFIHECTHANSNLRWPSKELPEPKSHPLRFERQHDTYPTAPAP